MIIVWILAPMAMLTGSFQEQSGSLTREQLLTAAQAAHTAIHDVEFVYNGTERSAISNGADTEATIRTFQGRFLYRNDGASFVDVYLTPFDGSPVERQIHGFLQDRLNSMSIVPDLEQVGTSSSNTILGLYQTGLPGRFWFLWFFHGFDVGNEARISKLATTVEALDGVDCLRVDITAGRSNAALPTDRIWLDLERGGHALRYEMFTRDGLRSRVRDVQLKPFPTPDGEMVWLPVKATYESFMRGAKRVDEPVRIETYHVVENSVRINQGLSDRRFVLPDAKSLNPNLKTAKEFAREADQTRTTGLAEALAKADEEGPRLIASAPSRRRWPPVLLSQLGLTLVGIGLLCAAMVLRRRFG